MTATEFSLEVQALRDELNALREAVLPPRFSLQVFQPGPYIGQGATIVARSWPALTWSPISTYRFLRYPLVRA